MLVRLNLRCRVRCLIHLPRDVRRGASCGVQSTGTGARGLSYSINLTYIEMPEISPSHRAAPKDRTSRAPCIYRGVDSVLGAFAVFVRCCVVFSGVVWCRAVWCGVWSVSTPHATYSAPTSAAHSPRDTSIKLKHLGPEAGYACSIYAAYKQTPNGSQISTDKAPLWEF